MPKISVITPTYNRSWIISQAINSVLTQNYKDFELILIDDGSTDSTQEIISRIKDPRLIYLKHDHNQGQSAARNLGLQHAKSELITYLDSDNVWFPNFLSVMLEELTDSYSLAYSNQNVLLMGGTKDNLKVLGRQMRCNPYNPAQMLLGNFIDINSVIHRKSIIDLIGNFDESLKSLEDYDFFARLVIKTPFKVKHVDQVLGEYRFFLKETADTIENEILSNAYLLEHFNLNQDEGDELIIKQRILAFINKPSK